MADSRPAIPFPFAEEADAFDHQFGLELHRILEEIRCSLIPADNVRRYYHGRSWQAHNSSNPDEISHIRQHGHNFVVEFASVVKGDLSLIENKMADIISALYAAFSTMLYSTVSDACDRSGNVVGGSDMSPAQKFLHALKTIEFAVNKDGQPSLPELHGGHEAIEALRKDLEQQGPEFMAEAERWKQLKIDEALQREAERRSRFKPHQED